MGSFVFKVSPNRPYLPKLMARNCVAESNAEPSPRPPVVTDRNCKSAKAGLMVNSIAGLSDDRISSLSPESRNVGKPILPAVLHDASDGYPGNPADRLQIVMVPRRAKLR